MPMTAKVFTTGNSQAVRLPKAFRVNAREMWIVRNEHTGEITLSPKPEPDALQAFLSELQSLPTSDEFVPPRDDAPRGDPLADWPESRGKKRGR
jgi:antitoxin VapB